MNESSIVDSKVVELSLQNKEFETNATKSISTIEKLKESLKFTDTGKGLIAVNANTKTLSAGIESLSGAFQTVQANAKLSIGEISKIKLVGDAIDYVKGKIGELNSLMSDFTIKQIDAGFTKYSQKTESVQTIMSATGKSIEEVNEQLDKLNWFTDETSYSFVDMTSNIGKFTNNGVSLERATTAMQGISTWAAKSGAKIGEASRAMYNLSQAMAVGSVKLMDWKSIENANMATTEFKEAAIQTAEAMHLLTKQADGTWKTLAGHEVTVTNFNESLKDEWFSSEVLLDTLNRYGEFTDELYKFMDNIDGNATTSKVLEYIEEFAETGSLKNIEEAAANCGVSVSELKEALVHLSSEEYEFGRKALRAAQEAKTLEDALDATRDAVSSAWMNTFELLFGNYEESKKLWTDMANSMWDIFAGPISNMNDTLSEAFDSTKTVDKSDWEKFSKTGITSPAYLDRLRKVAEQHDIAVNDIASNEEWLASAINDNLLDFNLLEEAYSSLFESSNVDEELLSQVEALNETDEAFQDLVKSLEGYTADDIAKVTFGDGKYVEGYEDLEKQVDKVIESLGLTQADGEKTVEVLKAIGLFGGTAAGAWADYTDEELKALGMNQEQIAQFREMQSAANDFGDALEDAEIDTKSGAQLWTGSLYNLGNTITGVLDAISSSWESVFPPATADIVYTFLERLYNGTSKIKDFVETSTGLRTVFTGIASAAKIVLDVVGGIGSTIIGAIKASGILKLGAWSLTTLSKIITAVQTFLTYFNVIPRISNLIVGAVNLIRGKIEGVFKAFTSLPIIRTNFVRFAGAFKTISKEFIPNVEKLGNRFKMLGGSIKNYFKDGFSFDAVKKSFKAFKVYIIDFVKNLPGVKQLGRAFESLGISIKRNLKKIGIDTDKVKEQLGNFFKNLKIGSVDVGKIVSDRFGKISTAFKSVFSNKANGGISKASETLGKFKAAFSKTFGGMPTLVKTVKNKFHGFFTGLSENGGLSIKNFGTIFKGIGSTIKNFFTDSGALEDFKSGFKSLYTNVKDLLGGFGIDISPVANAFKTIKDKAVELVTKGIDFIGPKFKAGFELAKNKVIEIGSKGLDFIRPKLETAGKLFGGLLESAKKNAAPIGKAFKKAFSNVPKLFSNISNKVGGFFTRIKEEGGLTVDNVVDTVSSVANGIIDFFTSGNVWDDVKASFTNLWEDIKNSFAEKGVDVTPIENAFGVIGTVAGTAFDTVSSAASKAWGWITDLYNKLKESPTVQKNIDNFKTAFTKFGTGIGDHLKGAKEKFSEFFKNVKEMGGFKLDNIGDIFKNFKDTVVDYFTNFEGFQAIKDAFGNLWADIKAKLAENGIDIDGWKQKITDFVDTVSEKVSAFAETVSNFEWPTSLDQIPTFISDVMSSFNGEDGKFNLMESLSNMFGTTVNAAEVEGDLDETSEEVVSFKERISSIFEAIAGIAKTVIKYAEPILKGVIVVMAAKKIVSLVSSITRLIKANAKDKEGNAMLKKGAGLLLMAMAIGSIAKSIMKLRSVPLEELEKGVLVIGEIAAILWLLSKGMKNVDSLALFGMAAVIAAISLSLIGLSMVKRTKLDAVKGMLMEVIGMAALLAFASKGLSSGNSGGIAMIGLALTIAAIGASLGLLTYVDEDKLENAKEAIISVIQWATVLSGVTGIFDPAWSSLLAIAGVIAVAAGVIWALSQIELNEDLIKKVEMFNDVLLKMSLAGLAVAAIGALGGVGTMTSGLAALGELEGIGVAVTAILAMINALVEHISKDKNTDLNTLFDTYLKPMFDLLGKIAGAIGEVIGRFIGGLAGAALEEAASYMPQIAEFLTSFNEILSAAPENGDIKQNVKKLGTLIKAVGKVSWAGLKTAVGNAISNKLTGKDSVENFAEAVGGTIGVINAWNEAMGGENGEGVKIAKLDKGAFDELVTAVQDAGGTGFNEAITSFVGNVISKGEDKSSTERFAEACGILSKAITEWNTAMEGVDNIVLPPEGFDDLRQAITDIQMDELWRAFGALFVIGEDQDPIGTFKSNTEKLADALTYWKTETDKLGTDYKIDSETLNANIGAIKDALAGVDNKGIFAALGEAIESFFGADQASQIEQFKTNAVNLGAALSGFSDSLGENFDTETFTSVAAAIEKLGAGITGISSLSTSGLGDDFGNANKLFSAITTGLMQLAGQSSDVDGMKINTDNLTAVSEAASLLSDGIVAMSEIDLTSGDINNETKRQDFIDAIDALKTSVESLAGMDTSGVDTLNSAVHTLNETELKSLNEDAASAGSDLMSSLSSSISNDTSSSSAIGDVMTGVEETIRGEYDYFGTMGWRLMHQLGKGIKDNYQNEVIASVNTAMTEAKGAMGNGYGAAYNAGWDFVRGFADGVELHIFLATAQAAAMANRAAEAVRRALNIKSPSKVTEGFGKFFGEGFEIGIAKKMHDVTVASADLGTAATDGLNRAVKGISSILSSDIDSDPVIRPVLDLSEIQNGAGMIGDMLNLSEPVTVTGAMSDISYSTRYRNPADDILSAINSLGKTLGNNRNGDTYNINGVTYDDGSNVSTAVKSLVQAAKINRRMN